MAGAVGEELRVDEELSVGADDLVSDCVGAAVPEGVPVDAADWDAVPDAETPAVNVPVPVAVCVAVIVGDGATDGDTDGEGDTLLELDVEVVNDGVLEGVIERDQPQRYAGRTYEFVMAVVPVPLKTDAF